MGLSVSEVGNTPTGLDLRLEVRFDKCDCSKCGASTYRVCVIGNRVVCPECFRKNAEAWAEIDRDSRGL